MTESVAVDIQYVFIKAATYMTFIHARELKRTYIIEMLLHDLDQGHTLSK